MMEYGLINDVTNDIDNIIGGITNELTRLSSSVVLQVC